MEERMTQEPKEMVTEEPQVGTEETDEQTPQEQVGADETSATTDESAIDSNEEMESGAEAVEPDDDRDTGEQDLGRSGADRRRSRRTDHRR